MSAVFADTFYWIALTNLQDSEHERAKHFSRSVRPAAIVTTEYVLTEYLNYFAAWGRNFRLKAAGNVEAILASPMVILPHSQDFLRPVWSFTETGSTRAIASPTASP